MEGEQEYFFPCPYCYSEISMVLEVHHGGQEYIEDCEVCCRPISISYKVEDSSIVSFLAKSLDE